MVPNHHDLTTLIDSTYKKELGFLGVRFEVRGGGAKISPCVKLVRIMLETSNLALKYTHECSFRKYIF